MRLAKSGHLADRIPACILGFMAPLPSSIGALLDAGPPDRPALIAGDRTIRYGALAEESRRVAGALAALGIGAGDRVAI